MGAHGACADKHSAGSCKFNNLVTGDYHRPFGERVGCLLGMETKVYCIERVQTCLLKKLSFRTDFDYNDSVYLLMFTVSVLCLETK